MAEHIWTVLCEKTLLDREVETLSLIEITESISVEGLEQKIQEALKLGKKGAFINTTMQLVSWWFRSDPTEDRLQARFSFENPAGVRLHSEEMSKQWEAGDAALRVFIKFARVPVTEPGLYWFVVERPVASKKKEPRWIVATRVPLMINPA